ncbi:zinc finger BED domain-containing protein 4-like [Harpegnathos saltator]|uniref:zinc finger BED domain-containing protein 4-like n=1 Tax=Harpegnathos saltator TaxID=610380 RepID=UPI000DBEF0F4|nr:zinc finger BED domain-containing protein 4-like [Harpegnathos saltator]
MLERFIELSEKISCIILQYPTAPPMLSVSELQSAKEFVQLLEPFKDATKIICGEHYLTASKVIPIVNILRNKLQAFEPDTDIGHHFKKALIDQFMKRFESLEQVLLLAIVTILDPRFKNINFIDKIACSQAINKITRFINSRVINTNLECQRQRKNSDNNDEANFWSYHENLVNLNISRQVFNQDPDQMSEDFPRDSPLSALAIKYQSLIATSVPSERLFSEAGKIMTEERNRLTSDHLNQLLFLHSLDLSDWHL